MAFSFKFCPFAKFYLIVSPANLELAFFVNIICQAATWAIDMMTFRDFQQFPPVTAILADIMTLVALTSIIVSVICSATANNSLTR